MRSGGRWVRLAVVASVAVGIVAPRSADAIADAAPGLDIPPVLAPANLAAQPVPSGPGLTAVLRRPLASRGLGRLPTYSVVDPGSGNELGGASSSTPATPASTAKILTAAAVLVGFGPDARLATTVAEPQPGRLVLVGAGDPLLMVDSARSTGRASLAELARRIATALRQRQPTGPLRVRLDFDDSLFSGPKRSPAWESSYTAGAGALVPPITALMADRGFVAGDVDHVPALEATKALAAKLTAAGVKVQGKPTAVVAGPAAPPVAQVFSPPMSELVSEMLRESDNVAAEMLGHLAGGKVVGEYSFAGGARGAVQVLQQLGVPTTGVILHDASGLSRSDRIPALTLAQTLAASLRAETPSLWPITAGLPIAGFAGTLADRFDTAQTRPARGYVRAKTGTLSGVSALAGTVLTRSGATLVFAFIAPRATDTWSAAAAWDQAAAALAGCGCGMPAGAG